MEERAAWSTSCAWTGARRWYSSAGRFFFLGLLVAEQLAHLVEEALRLRIGVLAGDGGELLEQVALLLGELFRHLHRDPDVLVAALVAVELGDALALEPEHLAALGAGGDLHLHLAVERGHLDCGPQRRLGEADGHLADDLGVLADEDG